MMKSLVFSVAILVLALALDAYAHPRNRQRPGGRVSPGGRPNEGRLGGHRGKPSRHCRLVNATSNEVLCNSTCPQIKTCEPDSDNMLNQLLPDVNVFVCKFQACPTEESSGCPTNTTCIEKDNVFQCRPNATSEGRRGRRGRRHHHSSDEEDDVEDADMDVEEEEEESSDEDRQRCKETIGELLRQTNVERRRSGNGQGQRPNLRRFFGRNPSDGGQSRGARGGERDGTDDIRPRDVERFGGDLARRSRHHGQRGSHVCSILNTTSTGFLCNDDCPEFRTCVNDPDFNEGRPEIVNLDFSVCKFQACNDQLDCPSKTTCVMNDEGDSECRPNVQDGRRRRQGNGSERAPRGESEDCRRIFHDILEEAGLERSDRPQGERGPSGDRQNRQDRQNQRPGRRNGGARQNGENTNGGRRRGRPGPL